MSLTEINIGAVFLAALSSFMLGGIWYSKPFFLRVWLEGCGLTELDLKQSDPRLVFGVSFFLALIPSIFMSVLLGENTTPTLGGMLGFLIGTTFVASALGISYIFEQRPFRLFLVNGGYHVLQFTLIGFVLGVMS